MSDAINFLFNILLDILLNIRHSSGKTADPDRRPGSGDRSRRRDLNGK